MSEPCPICTREAIVAEARSWLKTPFLWQASVKGRGCDCRGLIVGIARALARDEAQAVEATLANYSKVDPRALKAGMTRLFDKAAEPAPGDVLLLIVGGKAQHLAIYSAPRQMIHCTEKGRSAVMEVPMGRVWFDAIDSIWAWRGIA